MARNVSIRKLRNSTAEAWVRSSELRRIVSEAPADPGLLQDLDDVRGPELDNSSRATTETSIHPR
jgi:hypothetical protein